MKKIPKIFQQTIQGKIRIFCALKCNSWDDCWNRDSQGIHPIFQFYLWWPLNPDIHWPILRTNIFLIDGWNSIKALSIYQIVNSRYFKIRVRFMGTVKSFLNLLLNTNKIEFKMELNLIEFTKHYYKIVTFLKCFGLNILIFEKINVSFFNRLNFCWSGQKMHVTVLFKEPTKRSDFWKLALDRHHMTNEIFF